MQGTRVCTQPRESECTKIETHYSLILLSDMRVNTNTLVQNSVDKYDVPYWQHADIRSH